MKHFLIACAFLMSLGLLAFSGHVRTSFINVPRPKTMPRPRQMMMPAKRSGFQLTGSRYPGPEPGPEPGPGPGPLFSWSWLVFNPYPVALFLFSLRRCPDWHSPACPHAGNITLIFINFIWHTPFFDSAANPWGGTRYGEWRSLMKYE